MVPYGTVTDLVVPDMVTDLGVAKLPRVQSVAEFVKSQRRVNDSVFAGVLRREQHVSYLMGMIMFI